MSEAVSFTVRLAPSVHELLRAAAAAERRSMANLLEVLIATHCPGYLPDPFGLPAEPGSTLAATQAAAATTQ